MAQIKVRFFKSIGVPSEPESNAFYFVENEDETISMFVTDADGNLMPPGNPEFVIATMAEAMASKAPIASPAFTGNPTAPTQTAGNNSQRLATTAFVTAAVSTAIADLIGGAPGALDTLNELAAALSDDADFAATITSQLAGKVPTSRTVNGHALSANITISKSDVGLGSVDNTSDAAKPVSTATQTALNLKAPLASPTFTGNPAGPTQAEADESTKLATTAFVKRADSRLKFVVVDEPVTITSSNFETYAGAYVQVSIGGSIYFNGTFPTSFWMIVENGGLASIPIESGTYPIANAYGHTSIVMGGVATIMVIHDLGITRLTGETEA